MPLKKISRRVRHRFGVASTCFVVRPHLPWLNWVMACLLLSVCILSSYYFFRQETGRDGGEVEMLRRELFLQREELLALRTRLGGGQSLVEMERSVKSELLAKVHNLERENAALKEDMLLFERLVLSPREEAGVRIESFRVQQDGEGRYRYRWLVGYQPGRQVPEFHGRVQIAVSLGGGDEGRALLLPEGDANAIEYRLDLKTFSRREGGFVVPRGALVKGVELRVLQNGVVKAKRVALL